MNKLVPAPCSFCGHFSYWPEIGLAEGAMLLHPGCYSALRLLEPFIMDFSLR